MDHQQFAAAVLQLEEHYRVSDKLTEKLSTITLIALVGPTGVGKSSIIKQTKLPYLLSDVTRSPRPGEADGVDYRFCTNLDTVLQDLQEGNYIQFLVGHTGEFYGVHGDMLPVTGTTCISAIIASALPVFERLGFREIKKVYILPPNYEEWMRRVAHRATDELNARLLEARESLLIVQATPEAYSFVINDDMAEATTTVLRIAQGQSSQVMNAAEAVMLIEQLIEKLTETLETL